MNFNLTEEELMLQIMVKDFNEREIEPIAKWIDREEKLPDDLIAKISRIRLFGMAIPRKYGGNEANNLNCILAIEQLAYSGTGVWWLVAFNNSIPATIYRYGTEELKGKYIRPLIDGSLYSSIQFTEEETGADPKMLKTTAIPGGEDYVINGMKRFSTFGARPGYAILWAKDEAGACTAFVIQKNVDGYTATKQWSLMGGGGIEAVDVYFENVRVPKGNLLGEKGKGFDILLWWIAAEKIEQCAACVGIAQAALDESVKYSRSRTIKRGSISREQGFRWLLAEMYSRIEAARWLTYRTVFLQDQGYQNWQTEAAVCKLFVVPTTTDVVEQGKRIHGTHGYIREFKIERLYRSILGASAIATSLEINRSIVGASIAGL